MKILSTITTVFIASNLFAQFELSTNSELNVQIFNNSNEDTIDFVLEPPYRISDEIYNWEYFWESNECNCAPLDF